MRKKVSFFYMRLVIMILCMIALTVTSSCTNNNIKGIQKKSSDHKETVAESPTPIIEQNSSQESTEQSSSKDNTEQSDGVILEKVDDTANTGSINFINGCTTKVNEDGHYFVAEAGAIKSDAKQGVIVLKEINKKDNKVIGEKKFLSPQKHGYIKITLCMETRDYGFSFSLVSQDGFETSFDTETGFYEPPFILTKVDDKANSSKINFTNGWKSDLQGSEEKGKYTYFIAEFGSLKANPKQGVAIVRVVDFKSGETITQKQFLTPSMHGKIKATDFNGFNISTIAEDGYKWIFNIFDSFREN